MKNVSRYFTASQVVKGSNSEIQLIITNNKESKPIDGAGNNTTTSLSNCDVAINIQFENGVLSEFRRIWDTWDVAEAKIISIPNQGKIRKVSVGGSFKLNDGNRGTFDLEFVWKAENGK